MTDEIEIETGEKYRLLIRPCEVAAGLLVGVARQYRDRAGIWRLSDSGLLLQPEIARRLAPALLEVATRIDGAPVDPWPTDRDREDSRMP